LKRVLLAAIASTVAVSVHAADVSASIGVSQPGLYGQINIGEFPRPAVIYAQPILIEPAPRVVYVQPVYLRVPPGHEKHWSKHCARYGACGRPVYFVREDWYQTVYVPRYGKNAGHDQGKGHGHDGGNGRDNGKGKGR
jgi:hypothetical protein